LENLKGRDHVEDLGVDRKINRKDLRLGWEGVDWIHLSQDRDRFHKRQRIS
jgi:hypothetical protein